MAFSILTALTSAWKKIISVSVLILLSSEIISLGVSTGMCIMSSFICYAQTAWNLSYSRSDHLIIIYFSIDMSSCFIDCTCNPIVPAPTLNSCKPRLTSHFAATPTRIINRKRSALLGRMLLNLLARSAAQLTRDPTLNDLPVCLRDF